MQRVYVLKEGARVLIKDKSTKPEEICHVLKKAKWFLIQFLSLIKAQETYDLRFDVLCLSRRVV